MINEDFWQKEEFEDHVASILVSLYETSIRSGVKNNPVKAARLTEAHIVQARVFGPYIPGKDRAFLIPRVISAPNNDFSVLPMGFDTMNDALPDTACVSLPGGINTHYRQMAFVQRLNELPAGVAPLEAPFFRLFYFSFPNKGKVEGFSAYFSVDPKGRIRLAKMGNFDWASDPNTPEALKMISHVLQSEADRRFCWQIEAKEKIAHAFLGCQEEQIKSLLYARSLPLTSTGRKRPILHLVESHRRRLKNGTDVDVRDFLRGTAEVEMGGTLFKVHAPSSLGLKTPGEKK